MTIQENSDVEALFVERLRRVVERYPDHTAIEGTAIEGTAIEGTAIEGTAIEGTAIEGTGECLSYQQLWALSGRAARGLRSLGIDKESVVGLALPKSPELIAAMIGCWRLRAAFVPLPLDLLGDRLRAMIEDAAPIVIVSQNWNLIGDTPSVNWHDLVSSSDDKSPESPTPETAEMPEMPGSVNDLAWIIFTSGSTGRPRGVAVEHRGFVPVIDAQRKEFFVEHTSRILQFYSNSFDASLSDVGTALLSGATLCLEDSGTLATAGSLMALLRDRRITHADVPPALLAIHSADEAPDNLQTVIIGGEVCPAEVVQDWGRRFRVVNVYGPTEATICTSLCHCDATWSRPLIGQPLPGVDYVVVDERGEPVSPGEVGELWIGGACLAREYVGRPEDTTARFTMLDGRRMYRSGDRVRFDTDGEFVFVGRIDRQVQIHGLRVELGDVEAAVMAVEHVTRCAVLYRKRHAADDRSHLIAFVETQNSGGANETTIRQVIRKSLIERIPKAMWPTRFEILSRIPTTPSGKPDLPALANRPLSDVSPATTPPPTETPPTETPATQELMELFRSVLGVDVGPDDDFFECDGDSLMVMALCVGAQRRDLVLPGFTVLRERTPRRIARSISAVGDLGDRLTDVRTTQWLRGDVLEITSSKLSHLSNSPHSVHSSPVAGSQEALLTGATGFLGGRLLLAWIARNGTQVTCVIRAENDEAARRRLQAAFDAHGLAPRAGDWEHITCVAGDVSQDRFGWDTDRWRAMSQQVDTVVHCAARVHLLESYEDLREHNVVGTANVLQFTTTGPLKRLHYASTLSVFVGSDRNKGRMLESDDLTGTAELYGGYAQSKWAAEVLVRSCGIPPTFVDIYRFGLLTGATSGSSIPERDLLTMTVKGLAKIGCVPNGNPDLQVDITPIDFAVDAMATLADAKPSHDGRSRCWHIANPTSLSARLLFDAIVAVGRNIQRVDAIELSRRIEQEIGGEGAATRLSLCRWLNSDADYRRQRSMDLFQATRVQFDQEQTLRELAKHGLECPMPQRELIELYVSRILGDRA